MQEELDLILTDFIVSKMICDKIVGLKLNLQITKLLLKFYQI